MKEELLKGLTEEQIVKVKVCKSQEELFKLLVEGHVSPVLLLNDRNVVHQNMTR